MKHSQWQSKCRADGGAYQQPPTLFLPWCAV